VFSMLGKYAVGMGSWREPCLRGGRKLGCAVSIALFQFGVSVLIVHSSVYEMSHHMPFPLRNRTFSTLVVSAIDTKKSGTPSFILVQIPIDLTKVSTAVYSTGTNSTQLEGKLQKKKVVLGQYVSIERCKIIKNEDVEAKEEISWDMATASDAGGWLPMMVQKLGVPGAIVKDVGWFMTFAAQRRGRDQPKATSGGAAS
jgi:hypothetical protein